MKKQSLIFATILLLLSVFAAPKIAHPANAQLVGTVCIAPQGTTTSGCPTPPVHFAAQAAGTHLIVAVNIAGSDALNGFRIFVKTDNTVLNPLSADLTNTLLAQPLLTLANCVNGAGTGCSLASGDGPGVVDVGAVSLTGLSLAPTTGGLFEITYNVLSGNSATIGYVAGCAGSSVTGSCITITNGGALPNMESAHTATYGNVEGLAISAPTSVTATIGALTTFTVTGSDSDTHALTLSATGLPAGATLATSGTNPVVGTVSYTPANGPVSASAVFTVTDTMATGTEPTTLAATTTITVSAPDVAFFGGKLSWTHHLSLAKNANMQTWTAKVTNPGLETAYAVVVITGTNGVGTFTATSAPLTLTSGASIDATVTQLFGSTDVGTKFHFTAMIMWGTSPTALTSMGANTKSGAFAVVS